MVLVTSPARHFLQLPTAGVEKQLNQRGLQIFRITPEMVGLATLTDKCMHL